MKKLVPMLARLGDTSILKKAGYIFEPKLDGIRALCLVDNKPEFSNRHGVSITYKYPELTKFPRLQAEKCIFDGEIVAYNQEGIPDINLILQRHQTTSPIEIAALSKQLPASYVVFDILMKDGVWLLDTPLIERKKILASVIKRSTAALEKIFFTNDGPRLWKEVVRHKLEGVMAKKIQGHYYPGIRTDEWLKIKLKKTIDCVIVGFTQKNRKISSLALAVYAADGTLQYIGKVGTGFSEEMVHILSGKLNKLKATKPAFVLPSDIDRSLMWVKPKLVGEIRYLEVTKAGRLRVPVFIRLRDDKDPKECTLQS